MAITQPQPPHSREAIFAELLGEGAISSNHEWLAKIVATWLMGESVLPDYLGLTPVQFKAMCDRYFPCYPFSEKAVSGASSDFSRMPEKEDLEKLLRDDKKEDSEETEWVISIIVAACLGFDHLWQDLGVWERPELTALMRHNFPALAERNNKDMKWKKFLYKQMCEAEGIYVCRAPSCEVCTDYANCFNTD